MTRSEERLQAGTRKVETGRPRPRKFSDSENVSTTVPVSHEEVTATREPIADGNVGKAQTTASEPSAAVATPARLPGVTLSIRGLGNAGM